MTSTSIVAILTLALLAICSCQHPGPRFDARRPSKASALAMESMPRTNKVNPDLLKPPTDLFTLGPGDKLELELLDDPTTKTLTTVGPDGKIYFQLLPGLDVWGLTLSDAKAAIERELGKFIRDRVQVSVTLRAV